MNIKNVMMMAAMMPAFALAETNSNCASPSPVSASAFPTKWRSPPLSPSDRYTTISRTIMY